jgi:hypothetical protein
MVLLCIIFIIFKISCVRQLTNQPTNKPTNQKTNQITKKFNQSWCSQEPVNDYHVERNVFISHYHSSLKINFNFYHPIYGQVSWVASFFQVLSPKACIHLYTLQRATCSSYITLRVILLIYDMQVSPPSLYCLSLRSKYFPPYHILKTPKPTFFLQCDRPSFTLTHNNKHIQTRVNIYIYIYSLWVAVEKENESQMKRGLRQIWWKWDM